MKKILSVIALATIIAVAISSCNNRPPFERLAAAVDSLNAQYEAIHGTTEKAITYDQWENVVHFNTEFPVVIEQEVFEPIAANIKERFLKNLVTDNESDIATQIIEAKANVIINIHGINDTSYEVLITNNEIVAANDAAHMDAVIEEQPAEEQPETLSQEQIEQELLEGNAPSIGE